MRRLSVFILSMLAIYSINAASYGLNEEPYRLLNWVNSTGSTIKLDDGSFWNVEENMHRMKVKLWCSNDQLVIYPVAQSRLFYKNKSRFYISNKTNYDFVRADLALGPIVGGPCNNQIIYIDYDFGEILLQDGQGYTSSLKVDRKDLQKIQNWLPNQSIIYGSNNFFMGGTQSFCDYILINVECNDYVFADMT